MCSVRRKLSAAPARVQDDLTPFWDRWTGATDGRPVLFGSLATAAMLVIVIRRCR